MGRNLERSHMRLCPTDRAAESAGAAVRGAFVRRGGLRARLRRVLHAALGGEAPAVAQPPAASSGVDELQAARELADQARRAKALFLSNMSHELRTPMHAVLSYAQLGRDATSAAEQREYFERIAERGQALLRTLNDIVDLSRLESGSATLELAPHDLEALLRYALSQADPEFRRKGLQIAYQRVGEGLGTRAVVDSIRIGQVFAQLLDNAARYSPEGGRIHVQLSATSLPASSLPFGSGRARPALELAITDQGLGIPESELQLVFEKFMKSSRTRNTAGGTGLGLAICREIVALHHGAIWAANNAGPGATFCVALPLTLGANGSGEHA
jgi:signal transduction histidine kinase